MVGMEPRIEICGRCGGLGMVHAASGAELAEARRACGLTVRRMATLLGVGKSFVSQLENNHRTASPEMVKRWFYVTDGRSHGKR